jgi:adenylate cyclase
MDTVNHFREGRRHYLSGNWDKAITAFNEARKANPDDHLAQTYVERCEVLKASPPAGAWDGVWVMKSK